MAFTVFYYFATKWVGALIQDMISYIIQKLHFSSCTSEFQYIYIYIYLVLTQKGGRKFRCKNVTKAPENFPASVLSKEPAWNEAWPASSLLGISRVVHKGPVILDKDLELIQVSFFSFSRIQKYHPGHKKPIIQPW